MDDKKCPNFRPASVKKLYIRMKKGSCVCALRYTQTKQWKHKTRRTEHSISSPLSKRSLALFGWTPCFVTSTFQMSNFFLLLSMTTFIFLVQKSSQSQTQHNNQQILFLYIVFPTYLIMSWPHAYWIKFKLLRLEFKFIYHLILINFPVLTLNSINYPL